MIDAKNLSEFLTRNVHSELYPHFFVISRNGKLVAYSSPVNINQIEDQAALVAMTWKDSMKKLNPTKRHWDSFVALNALTVESESYNIIVQPIQSNLLLVLVGGQPPGGASGFKITPETKNDRSYPPDAHRLEDDLVALTARAKPSESAINALRLQRRKLDKLVHTILAEATRLKMPEDSQYGKPFL